MPPLLVNIEALRRRFDDSAMDPWFCPISQPRTSLSEKALAIDVGQVVFCISDHRNFLIIFLVHVRYTSGSLSPGDAPAGEYLCREAM
jgi:hypothetical protein